MPTFPNSISDLHRAAPFDGSDAVRAATINPLTEEVSILESVVGVGANGSLSSLSARISALLTPVGTFVREVTCEGVYENDTTALALVGCRRHLSMFYSITDSISPGGTRFIRSSATSWVDAHEVIILCGYLSTLSSSSGYGNNGQLRVKSSKSGSFVSEYINGIASGQTLTPNAMMIGPIVQFPADVQFGSPPWRGSYAPTLLDA